MQTIEQQVQENFNALCRVADSQPTSLIDDSFLALFSNGIERINLAYMQMLRAKNRNFYQETPSYEWRAPRDPTPYAKAQQAAWERACGVSARLDGE